MLRRRCPVVGYSITVAYPAPEDLASTRNSYLRVTAVATDSDSLASRVDRSLFPRKVTVSLGSVPTEAPTASQRNEPGHTEQRGVLVRLHAAAQRAQPNDQRHMAQLPLMVGRRRPVPQRRDPQQRHDVHRSVRRQLILSRQDGRWCARSSKPESRLLRLLAGFDHGLGRDKFRPRIRQGHRAQLVYR